MSSTTHPPLASAGDEDSSPVSSEDLSVVEWVEYAKNSLASMRESIASSRQSASSSSPGVVGDDSDGAEAASAPPESPEEKRILRTVARATGNSIDTGSSDSDEVATAAFYDKLREERERRVAELEKKKKKKKDDAEDSSSDSQPKLRSFARSKSTSYSSSSSSSSGATGDDQEAPKMRSWRTRRNSAPSSMADIAAKYKRMGEESAAKAAQEAQDANDSSTTTTTNGDDDGNEDEQPAKLRSWARRIDTPTPAVLEEMKAALESERDGLPIDPPPGIGSRDEDEDDGDGDEQQADASSNTRRRVFRKDTPADMHALVERYTSMANSVLIEDAEHDGKDDSDLVVATVLFDYEPEAEDEIPLQEGSEVVVFEMDESGWWTGVCNGNRGLFPGSFVEVVTSPGPASPPSPDHHQAQGASDEEEGESSSPSATIEPHLMSVVQWVEHAKGHIAQLRETIRLRKQREEEQEDDDDDGESIVYSPIADDGGPDDVPLHPVLRSWASRHGIDPSDGGEQDSSSASEPQERPKLRAWAQRRSQTSQDAGDSGDGDSSAAAKPKLRSWARNRNTPTSMSELAAKYKAMGAASNETEDESHEKDQGGGDHHQEEQQQHEEEKPRLRSWARARAASSGSSDGSSGAGERRAWKKHRDTPANMREMGQQLAAMRSGAGVIAASQRDGDGDGGDASDSFSAAARALFGGAAPHHQQQQDEASDDGAKSDSFSAAARALFGGPPEGVARNHTDDDDDDGGDDEEEDGIALHEEDGITDALEMCERKEKASRVAFEEMLSAHQAVVSRLKDQLRAREQELTACKVALASKGPHIDASPNSLPSVAEAYLDLLIASEGLSVESLESIQGILSSKKKLVARKIKAMQENEEIAALKAEIAALKARANDSL